MEATLDAFWRRRIERSLGHRSRTLCVQHSLRVLPHIFKGIGSRNSQRADREWPISEGFLTYGSDSGHTATSNADAQFALNDEVRFCIAELSHIRSGISQFRFGIIEENSRCDALS